MHLSSPSEIFGMDGIIVLIVVVLVLFGSTQIPKLARSLGSAQKEFKEGRFEGASPDDVEKRPVLPIASSVGGPSPTPAPTTVETTDVPSVDITS